MRKNEKKIWFPAMEYGIGWGLPVTWQGWVVFLAYLILTVSGAGAFLIEPSPMLIIPYIIYVFLLTAILLFICWKKGEKLKFRWGKKS